VLKYVDFLSVKPIQASLRLRHDRRTPIYRESPGVATVSSLVQTPLLQGLMQHARQNYVQIAQLLKQSDI